MIRSQKNKNNKTKPKNLMKKQYLESYEELKKSIKDQQDQKNINLHFVKSIQIDLNRFKNWVNYGQKGYFGFSFNYARSWNSCIIDDSSC